MSRNSISMEDVGSFSTADVESTPITARGLDRVFRKLLFGRLEKIDQGQLVIREGDERHTFGDAESGLHVEIAVHDPAFYRQIVTGSTVGAADAWMDGHMSCRYPDRLVRLFARNVSVLDGLSGISGLGVRLLERLHYRFSSNTQSGSRRNISAHYDLGNDFFKLFLDPTMTYSSGIYLSDESTLYEASVEKLDRICRKLGLRPGMRLLEIGTGWGSFAMHAAREYGCEVTTTTISEEQHALATQRVAEAGLSDRVTVLKKDYRALEGRWERLVSIEMIEAVGHDYHDTYFKACSDLLTDDGQALIQAITIPDQRYDYCRKRVDFIKRYIFPGSCIPSTARIMDCVARKTDFRLDDLEDITLHYARTLKDWRDALMANGKAAEAMGYDARFQRLWEFYLAYCEGGFSERYIGTVQVLLSKPEAARGDMLS